MRKGFYSILAFVLLSTSAFAAEKLNQWDIVTIDYDLQGGINNPDNLSSFKYDDDNLGRIYLLPPTREGFEFMGWYEKSGSSLLDNNYSLSYIRPCDAPHHLTSEKTISVYARWGVKAKVPQIDESGCILVNDAGELYGALKIADSLTQDNQSVCISIQDDIVVNENLLAADGTPNEGEHYWWKPFEDFRGVIEGNGHFISGLYGNVGLIENNYNRKTVIQNLGIVDSYFSGENAGSFISYIRYYEVYLKNVYSTATVNGGKSNAGGLVGLLETEGDECVTVITASRARAPSSYFDDEPYRQHHSPSLIVENAYFAGNLMGANGGGLVGTADIASVKNFFFAGTSSVSGNFASIGQTKTKMCAVVLDGDLSSENTYYLDAYEQDDFKATAASSGEFSDGTILAKLNAASDVPVWKQAIGTDAYPKLSGGFYTIRYMLNGGENSESNPDFYSKGEDISLNPATKDGDTFEGWFLDSSFTQPVEKILATEWGDQKFYAKWESGYSITYVNDGSYLYGLHPNPIYRYADSATFKLKEPSGTGRTFEGWFTDSTFSTQVTELPSGNTEDIVLYAKWDAPKVKLIYHLYGGTMGGETNPEKVLNGEVINFKNPTREGYIFKGWYDGSKQYGSLKGYLDEPYLVNTDYSEINLYAKWTYEPKQPEIDAEGCYLVTNANELYYFNPIVNDDEELSYSPCIKIMNDITVNEGIPQDRMEVVEWMALNTITPFVGEIYGNGHTISGLYMDYALIYPGVYHGFISDDNYYGKKPIVHDLAIMNFYYDNQFYTYKVTINTRGGNIIRVNTVAPTPLRQNRLPKFDVKGRNPKVRPNYGVYF